MALKLAGRTLSSLTGILVLAAVLWALLNFVYAPSCGRFACSYTPSWWPQAQADSGDGCPDNLTAAATDAEWAAARLESLAGRKVTTGLAYDVDGAEHTYVSGEQDEHPSGICSAEQGLSCQEVLPLVLAPGARADRVGSPLHRRWEPSGDRGESGMTEPTEHIVIGQGNGDIWPRVVADHPHQRTKLVDMLLRDPEYQGVYARVHASVNFYVRSSRTDSNAADRWMTVGFYATFGAALFIDETTPDSADWCWAALRSTPIEDPPQIYYDQAAGTLFPPSCVMPLSELRDVILEWVRTGQRPTSVDWLPVNSLTWELTDDGGVHVPTGRRSAT